LRLFKENKYPKSLVTRYSAQGDNGGLPNIPLH
jgi:hypothetical protein